MPIAFVREREPGIMLEKGSRTSALENKFFLPSFDALGVGPVRKK